VPDLFVQFFFSAMKSAKPFTSRRALMLQQSSSIACHSRLTLLDVAGSLERFGVHSMSRVRRFQLLPLALFGSPEFRF
jgi:hypothetical protein